jgi:hypothetical protein
MKLHPWERVATASSLIIFGRFMLWAYHCDISAPLIVHLYRGSRVGALLSPARLSLPRARPAMFPSSIKLKDQRISC